MKGKITKSGKTGANAFKWNGKLKGKRLRRDTYRLVVVAVDGSGARSAVVRKRFRR
jgi:hypothetical protein